MVFMAGNISGLNDTFGDGYSNVSVTRLLAMEVHREHRRSFLTWLILILSANLSGALANLVIAVATLAYRPLRSCASSVMIAHCAVMDFIRSIVVYPMLSLIAFLAPYYDFPVWACR